LDILLIRKGGEQVILLSWKQLLHKGWARVWRALRIESTTHTKDDLESLLEEALGKQGPTRSIEPQQPEPEEQQVVQMW